MTAPQAPWRDLHLNVEQDQLVQSYCRLQMILAGKIRMQLLGVAVLVSAVSVVQFVFTHATPEMQLDDTFRKIVVWLGLVAVGFGIAFLAFLLQSSKTAEKRLVELPLTPHQVNRVAKHGVQAFELALFGRQAYRLLTLVRAYLKPSR